jgi:hypothetical protein
MGAWDMLKREVEKIFCRKMKKYLFLFGGFKISQYLCIAFETKAPGV